MNKKTGLLIGTIFAGIIWPTAGFIALGKIWFGQPDNIEIWTTVSIASLLTCCTCLFVLFRTVRTKNRAANQGPAREFTCSNCGESQSADNDKCPMCGEFLSEDQPKKIISLRMCDCGNTYRPMSIESVTCPICHESQPRRAALFLHFHEPRQSSKKTLKLGPNQSRESLEEDVSQILRARYIKTPLAAIVSTWDGELPIETVEAIYRAIEKHDYR